MKTAKTIAAGLGIGALGLFGVILLIAVLFAFSTAITAGVVALAWNVIGLHTVFNQPPLTFWQVVGVAVVINLLRSIFSGGSHVRVDS